MDKNKVGKALEKLKGQVCDEGKVALDELAEGLGVEIGADLKSGAVYQWENGTEIVTMLEVAGENLWSFCRLSNDSYPLIYIGDSKLTTIEAKQKLNGYIKLANSIEEYYREKR